jgi:hypothetical protein
VIVLPVSSAEDISFDGLSAVQLLEVQAGHI